MSNHYFFLKGEKKKRKKCHGIRQVHLEGCSEKAWMRSLAKRKGIEDTERGKLAPLPRVL